MKRIWIICLIIGLLCCTACGAVPAQPEDNTVTERVSATPQSAAEWLAVLREKLPFDDEMSETDQAAAIYGILDEDGYTGDTAMLISTMATPEEVAVFRADDVYPAQALRDLAQARIDQQTASYASYAPEEVPKLETAVVKTVGDYVIVCVCADNAAAAELVDSLS